MSFYKYQKQKFSLPVRSSNVNELEVDEGREADPGGVEPEDGDVLLDAAVGYDVLVPERLGQWCKTIYGYGHCHEDADAAQGYQDAVRHHAHSRRCSGLRWQGEAVFREVRELEVRAQWHEYPDLLRNNQCLLLAGVYSLSWLESFSDKFSKSE